MQPRPSWKSRNSWIISCQMKGKHTHTPAHGCSRDKYIATKNYIWPSYLHQPPTLLLVLQLGVSTFLKIVLFLILYYPLCFPTVTLLCNYYVIISVARQVVWYTHTHLYIAYLCSPDKKSWASWKTWFWLQMSADIKTLWHSLKWVCVYTIPLECCDKESICCSFLCNKSVVRALALLGDTLVCRLLKLLPSPSPSCLIFLLAITHTKLFTQYLETVFV